MIILSSNLMQNLSVFLVGTFKMNESWISLVNASSEGQIGLRLEREWGRGQAVGAFTARGPSMCKGPRTGWLGGFQDQVPGWKGG